MKPIPGQLNTPVPNGDRDAARPGQSLRAGGRGREGERAEGALRDQPLLQLRPEEAPQARMPEGEAEPLTPPLDFAVFGIPQPAGSKVAGRSKAGKLFVRDAAKGSAPWKRQVAQTAGEAMDGRELYDGPITLRVLFYVPRPQAHFGANGLRPSAPTFPTKRPDTTKLLRAVEDAMTGVVWRDDAQVVEQYACKLFGEPARCELHVAPTGVPIVPPPRTGWDGVNAAAASPHLATAHNSTAALCRPTTPTQQGLTTEGVGE